MAIVIALIGAAILVGLIFMQSNKLADPENKTAVYLDELPGLVALQGGGLYGSVMWLASTAIWRS